jgi:hypothetical protein
LELAARCRVGHIFRIDKLAFGFSGGRFNRNCTANYVPTSGRRLLMSESRRFQLTVSRRNFLAGIPLSRVGRQARCNFGPPPTATFDQSDGRREVGNVEPQRSKTFFNRDRIWHLAGRDGAREREVGGFVLLSRRL